MKFCPFIFYILYVVAVMPLNLTFLYIYYVSIGFVILAAKAS